MNQYFLALGVPHAITVFCHNANGTLKASGIPVFSTDPFILLTAPFSASVQRVHRALNHFALCIRERKLRRFEASVARVSNEGRRSAFYLPVQGYGINSFVTDVGEEAVTIGLCSPECVCHLPRIPLLEVCGGLDQEPFYDVADLIRPFAPEPGQMTFDTLYLMSNETGERYEFPLAA